MLNDLNIKISKAKEDLRRKQKLEHMLEKCKEELQKQEGRFRDLGKILKKEEKDVRKLESLSVSNLFFSILGNKDEKLDKEKEEYVAARLQYDECYSSIESLKAEMNGYTNELKKYLHANEDYNALIREKESLLISSKDKNSERLMEISDRITDLESDIKEIKEAITAGNNVQDALEDVIKSLEEARSWGTWDALGGGFLATAAKHSKMDKAKEQAQYAQKVLSVFNRELSDVDLTANIGLEIGSLATFADYFMDGILVDWFVQGKINDSLSKVKNTYHSIDGILDKLKKNLKYSSDQLDAAKEEIRVLIEES